MGNHVRHVLLSTAAACTTLLLAGCSVIPFLGRGDRQDSPEDDRFSEFTRYVPEPLDVQTSLDSVTWRMPEANATAVHFVAQYRVRKNESRLPEPDRPHWFHAVMTTEPSTTQALDDASTGPAALLPPVYPDLYQYVPQHCTFATVPPDQANQILDTENAYSGDVSERFVLEEVAVSTDCNLLVLTGTGYSS